MIETALTPPTSPTAPPLPPQTRLSPVAEPERIAALDVLRGVAIFGIFMVNMQFFAMPLMDMIPVSPAGDVALRDHVSWVIVKAFFEYKFISIFSLLFGMGMVVQMKRAEAKGRPFAPVYLRRLLVLMLIGLAHALLLWYGDILFLYAWVGLLVFLMRKLRPKVLVILALVGILAGVGVVGSFNALQAILGARTQPFPAAQVRAEAEPGDAAEPTEPVLADEGEDDRWARVGAALGRLTKEGDFSAWREIEVIAYKEGPLSLALIVRSVTFVMIMTAVTFGGFGFRVTGMFLLGAALMKLDFFSPRRRRWHWWMCGLGLPLGVAGELLAVSLMAAIGEKMTWALAMADPVHQLASFALCLGYTGAVTLLVNSGAVPTLGRMLAAVGRLALTNYLLQTLVSTLLMYWWGFAWFADVARPQQIALVLIIFAGQVVASVVWLRIFSIGPFEWLWRSLTYLKPQPMLR
jgi:uncharacterized protein